MKRRRLPPSAANTCNDLKRMPSRFKPVGRTQLLSNAVVSAIENAIRSKELVPEMKLSSEHELCNQFGVSRTVLREALRMLSARGLIRIEKGRGIFVSRISSDTVTAPLELYLQQQSGPFPAMDIIRARQLIEPSFAAEAALEHTAEHARQLRSDCDQLKAYDGAGETLAALDLAFHRHIAIASGNMVIPLLIKPIHALMPQLKSSVHAAVEEARYSAIEWHERILEHIVMRDADGARAAMQLHLAESERHLRQVAAIRTQVGSDAG